MTALALLLAWLADHHLGEPPDRWHPVAWLGRALAPFSARLPALSPTAAFLGGALVWLLAIGAVGALALWLQRMLEALPPWAGVPLFALALKPTFAWRMLRTEVQAVERALQAGLDAGRQRLRALCSRDVMQLDAVRVRETAVESLAENFNDSLVAPLFWFVLAGLPGAWIWRTVNTMDAMWGYRGRWEWAGKWPARADDALAWLPARLAAALLWRPVIPLRVLRREASLTPSPNGGWPMATMALRLGVRLSKPDNYLLNGTGRAADAATVPQAVVIANRAAAAAFALTVVALAMKDCVWA
jgi:adenosylcobinamide-phosphate synthase